MNYDGIDDRSYMIHAYMNDESKLPCANGELDIFEVDSNHIPPYLTGICEHGVVNYRYDKNSGKEDEQCLC